MTKSTTPLDAESLEGELSGTIYRDLDRCPAPSVLVLHGSGGEPADGIARSLAEAGFVAAAVQYFGDVDGIPDDLAEVPVEGVDSARAALANHDAVAGDEIGAYGASKGGELALLTGVETEGFGAVVSVVGSCYAWEGLTSGWEPAGASSWTVGGDPYPYVSFDREVAFDGTIRSIYESSLDRADPDVVRAATIPVENTEAPMLFASGGDDRMWPSSDFAATAIERLDRHDVSHPYEHLHFENAGHAIGPPGDAKEPLSERERSTLGGTAEADRQASETFWPTVRSFFDDHLGT